MQADDGIRDLTVTGVQTCALPILKRFLLAAIFAALLGRSSTPEYSIQAICYASSPGVPVSELVVGGPKDEKVDIAMVVWLIRGGGHAILFHSGFHRHPFLKHFPMVNYLRPHESLKTPGTRPE